MHASFIELSKYLKLEVQKGYTNKSIVGGFERLLPIWSQKALENDADEATVTQISDWLSTYSSVSLDGRKKIIKDIGNLLRELIRTDPGHQSPTASQAVTDQPHRSYQPKAVFAPLTVIQGIGEKMALKLRKLEIRNIYDLLHYYPRRYNDYSQLTPIRDLEYGNQITISGSIQSIQQRKAKSNRLQIVESVIGDGTGSLWVTWFNQPWLTNRLKVGSQIVCSGKVDSYMGRLCLNNPEWEPVDVQHLHTNRIVPVYSLTAGIQQKWLREKIFLAANYWSDRIKDYMPSSIVEAEKLLPLNEAVRTIHFPKNQGGLQRAIERLSFDELFFLQMGYILQKREWLAKPAQTFEVHRSILDDEINELPYQLTISQQTALEEIQNDLTSGSQMNRLLQGDVGSGKTVIARFAMEIVIRNEKQAAFLAPTSLLAQQHFDTLQDMLVRDKVLEENEIALLIGDTPEKEKEEIREDLRTGTIKAIIGTHALLEDPVEFAALQMVVIDEQHRFGVAQRAAIRAKGENPHILVMSATPIPRSLNLTLHGDLDVSTLRELPGGRIPVKTFLIYPHQKDVAYQKIREQVEMGYQAFIVYPKIDEDEDNEEDLSVISGFNELSNTIFPDNKIGLLHGRLKQEEKDSIMQRFRDKEMDILVSTTVIEVGMDIPNATIILIEGANHFGLAQLHQLRGRVGRNSSASYCYLVPDDAQNGENERLRKMTETNDGFELAEFDLKTRGPGDFFGTRQSGYRGLKLANISDIKLITRAREQAQSLIENDPTLEREENQALQYELNNLWKPTNGELS